MLTSPPSKTPLVVPLFIPHLGCPHQCIFCNQHSISGQKKKATADRMQEVAVEIELWLSRRKKGQEVQVAFFGGSFTALPMKRQLEMLQNVQPFLADGRVDAIRLSTRPDALDEEICRMLLEHGVRIVELGVQSMDDGVLEASGRGHTRKHVEDAMGLLQSFGFSTGGQLMIGLPSDTSAKALRSAEALTLLGPDFVRIYPTLVVQGSPLAQLFRQGRYRPLTLEAAVVLAGRLKDVFDARAIPVIRMGLQHSEGLLEDVLAGPYHPAFGELVLSRQYFKRLRRVLAGRDPGCSHQLKVAARDQSILRGKANANWFHLQRHGHLNGVRVIFDPGLCRNEMLLEKVAV